MKKRIWGVVFVLTILAALLLGCGAAESGKDTEEQGSKAISVADLEEEIQTKDSEKSKAENSNLQIVECDEQNEINASPDAEGMSATGSNTRMLRIDGEIYYDTGRNSDALRCGLMDQIIASTVPEEETPTEDNQSNFGTYYGYQRWTKGQVHVNIDGEWCIFQTSDAYRLTVTNGNNGEIVEMERSPEFWEIIEKYQNLDVTKSEKQDDRVGYSYCLRLYDKDDNLISTVTPLGTDVKLDGVYYADNGYGTVNELYLILDSLFGEAVPEATATQSSAGNIDTIEDVSMYVTYATDKGANVVLTNYSDKNMQCGDDYELHMLKDDEWYQVDYIIDNWAFNAIAYMMPKNEPVDIAIDWTHFHGTLPKGQYRIVKQVMDFRGTGDYTTYRLAAEFEVE